MTRRVLFPYEEISNVTSPQQSRSRAQNILKHGWQKETAYPRIDLHKPFPWKLESQEQRSWNFTLHCLTPVDILLRAYSHWQESFYLEPALRITLDWVRINSDESSKDISPFAWYDMAVGMRAYRIAYLLQAAEEADLLKSDERELLWNSLEQHALYLEQDANIAFHSNHGYFQIAGQLAMGRRFAHVSSLMHKAQEQGIERLRSIVTQHFSIEGVHLEHSPDYHRMLYSTLKELLDSGLVNDEDIRQQARCIETALAWFVYPDQKLVNFGDSYGASISVSEEAALNNWLTPEMRFMATGGRLGELPEEHVAYLEKSGYWIVRTPIQSVRELPAYSYLALNAAFHSRTHKHADDLSFVWYERGYKLLVDAGRYGYIGKTQKNSELWLDGFWYSDPWRVYCESTLAHNTLEFDGRSYNRRKATPYGSALQHHGQTNNGVYFVEAGCTQFASICHERFLFFKPNQWLIVVDVFDDTAAKPHEVKQWFHLGPELNVSLQGDQVVAQLPDDKGMLHCTSLLNDSELSQLYVGEEEPFKQGWISEKDRSVSPAPAFCFTKTDSCRGVFAALLSLNSEVKIKQCASSLLEKAAKAEFNWQDETGEHRLKFTKASPSKSFFRFFRSSEFHVDYFHTQKNSK